jgi:hypothetical protein
MCTSSAQKVYYFVSTNQSKMQLTAKLIQLLPLQTGTGKNGLWKKQEIIVETMDQYPKKICLSIWGDKINGSLLQVDKFLKLDYEIESREYSGKWYTDVKAWRIELVDNMNSSTGNISSQINNSLMDEKDVLPF